MLNLTSPFSSLEQNLQGCLDSQIGTINLAWILSRSSKNFSNETFYEWLLEAKKVDITYSYDGITIIFDKFQIAKSRHTRVLNTLIHKGYIRVLKEESSQAVFYKVCIPD